MVVKTRSYYQEKQRETAAEADTVYITSSACGGGARRSRRVKIMTHLFQEANTRTYKIYAPVRKPTQAAAAAAAEEEAAEALLSFHEEEEQQPEQEQYDNSPRSEEDDDTLSASASVSASAVVNHTCMNPMRPITKFMYRIGVYNIKQSSHYKTAYIIYDNTSRLFHVYSIVSNKLSNEADDAVPSATCCNLPEPGNTIQIKYSTYICEMAMNYIMTMIIPSNEYDYYIQDDILGVVIQDDEFRNTVFGADSSFYDIEGLLNDKSSTETITGFKTFMLVPSRNFWYDPAGYFITTGTSSLCGDNSYTSNIINSVMMILSQSN